MGVPVLTVNAAHSKVPVPVRQVSFNYSLLFTIGASLFSCEGYAEDSI